MNPLERIARLARTATLVGATVLAADACGGSGGGVTDPKSITVSATATPQSIQAGQSFTYNCNAVGQNATVSNTAARYNGATISQQNAASISGTYAPTQSGSFDCTASGDGTSGTSASVAVTVASQVAARDTSLVGDEAQTTTINLASLVNPAGGTLSLGTPSNPAFAASLQGTTASISDASGDANGTVTVPFTYTVNGQAKTGNMIVAVQAEPDVVMKSEDFDPRLAGKSYDITANGTNYTITPAGTKIQLKTGVNTFSIKPNQAGFYDLVSLVFPDGEIPLSGLGQKTWTKTLGSSDISVRVSHFRTDNPDITADAMSSLRIAYLPAMATPDAINWKIYTGQANNPSNGGAACETAPSGWASKIQEKINLEIAGDLKAGRTHTVTTTTDPNTVKWITNGGVSRTDVSEKDYVVCYRSGVALNFIIPDTALPGYIKGAIVSIEVVPSAADEAYRVELGSPLDGSVRDANDASTSYTRQGEVGNLTDVRPPAEVTFLSNIYHRIGSAAKKIWATDKTFAQPNW